MLSNFEHPSLRHTGVVRAGIAQAVGAFRRVAQAEADRLARYRANPDAYAREVLGISWWSMQIEIAASIIANRRTVVYAGHAVGKSHSMGGIVQWHYDCWDPSITLTTGPNWSSIHDLLWGEIKAQRPKGSPGRLLETMRLEDGPMHYAAGHNAESSSGFQGRHEARVLIVLDEAMGIPTYIWEASNAMMSSPDCRIVALGNPTETSGEYYDIRDDPAWNVIIVSCLDHPNIAAELAGKPAPYPKAVSVVWVDEMVKKHGIRVKAPSPAEPNLEAFEWPTGSGNWFTPNDILRARVLGLFPKRSSSAIWSEEWLKAARTTTLLPAPGTLPEIGCDVARFGDDNTTLFGRVGPRVTNRETYSKQGTMETAGRVADLAHRMAIEHKVAPHDNIPGERLIPIKVDDTGLGGGVTDRLKELGFKVYGIDFGSSANSPDDYANRGSEMWFAVAEIASKGRLDLTVLEPDVFKRLSKELLARQYKIQSDRTLRAESKEDLRKRLKRSPDDADALVLAFAPAAPGWQLLDISDAAERRRVAVGEKPTYMNQIVQSHAAQFDAGGDDGTCGECAYFKREGNRCSLRQLVVKPQQPGCPAFDLPL